MEEKIADLLGAYLEQTPDMQDCFWLDVQWQAKTKKLEVVIDSDTGVTFDKCKAVSRFLESHLDENHWLGDDYTLDVASPGADRPLRLPRQYNKHLGRQLEVVLKAGDTFTGKLMAVEEASIAVEEEVVTKDGKRKVKSLLTRVLPFDDIASSTVIISFK